MAEIIDCRRIAQIRSAFRAKKHSNVSALLKGADLSLAAAVELAGWMLHDFDDDKAADTVVRPFIANNRAVAAAITLLRKPSPDSMRLNLSQGRAEIRSVTTLTQSDRPWWQFLERFSKSAEEHGIDKVYSKALAGAFHEMADNVVQYAGENGKPATAIAAWHTTRGLTAFVVLDVGRGVRASLRQNPTWKSLADDKAALRGVLLEQATSKAGFTHGDGYRTVVQNFVERNGCLNVRSGGAEACAEMENGNHRVRLSVHPAFKGTRVAAWCEPSSGKAPKEPAMKCS